MKKTLDVNDCSFAHLTLMLLLHYLVKCRSNSLAVYNADCFQRLLLLLTVGPNIFRIKCDACYDKLLHVE